MRSVTAVLRIAREQIEARGDLGKQPHYAIFFGGLGLVAIALSFVLTEMQRPLLMGGGGAILAALAFVFGHLKTAQARTLNLRQERAIRQSAKEALEHILTHPIESKPLTREQRDTLGDILKRTGESEALRRLLNS
jgi:hypothetical protein